MSVEKLVKNIGKLTIGKDEVVKALRVGGLAEVFVSQNCSGAIFGELSGVAKFSNTAISRLDTNSDELGVKLKKHFAISVVGIKK